MINYFLHGDSENRKEHVVMASKSHHEESIIIIISFPFMLQVKYLQIKTLLKISRHETNLGVNKEYYFTQLTFGLASYLLY